MACEPRSRRSTADFMPLVPGLPSWSATAVHGSSWMRPGWLWLAPDRHTSLSPAGIEPDTGVACQSVPDARHDRRSCGGLRARSRVSHRHGACIATPLAGQADQSRVPQGRPRRPGSGRHWLQRRARFRHEGRGSARPLRFRSASGPALARQPSLRQHDGSGRDVWRKFDDELCFLGAYGKPII
jgi:hypothetical protein